MPWLCQEWFDARRTWYTEAKQIEEKGGLPADWKDPVSAFQTFISKIRYNGNMVLHNMSAK